MNEFNKNKAKKMVIYKATNTVNQKVYIGKTMGFLARRKRQHKNDAFTQNSRRHFAKSLRKYGWDAFSWEVIDTGANNEELIEKEKYWIRFYRANNPDFGYNHTEGGEGI